jgi:hypothetical protein
MLKRQKKVFAGVAVATLLAAGTGVGTALAREQANPVPDKVALGGAKVKHMLLLMNQDQNGKVSKQEFMQFMQAEFDRLDQGKSGELDVKELTHSRAGATPFTIAGK